MNDDRYVDFTVIPDALRALAAPSPAELFAARAVDVARSYVGQREVGGPNRGPFVERCQRWVGLVEGDPWCAGFVCLALHEAAMALGYGDTCPEVGSVSKLYAFALQNPELATVITDPALVLPGDVGIKGSTEGKAARIRAGRLASGHTWIVDRVLDVRPGHHATIEGNTSPAGAREGQGVYARTRSYLDPTHVGWIRFQVALLEVG